MTAPTQRSTGLDSNARGLAVLAVAVVVGLLLLLNAGSSGGDGSQDLATTDDTSPSTIDISGIGDDPDDTDDTDQNTTTTPDATTTSSSTVTDDTNLPSEVSVLVLNDGGPTGTAAAATGNIGEKGYSMQTAANAANPGDSATTTVYYAEGFEADAEAVAAVLGRSSDAVEPMPSDTLGPGADSANVVVVLGTDTPPVS